MCQACPWRIANLPGIPRVFTLLLECGNARSRDPFHPSPYDRRPSCRSRRPPLRSSRVRAPQTSTPNPQSLAPARSHLRLSDRLVAGSCALLMRPSRLIRSAIVLKPSTLLYFHHVLNKRKYRLLFSPKTWTKPGPKGPVQELIEAVVQMKQRNPSWGCPRIAQQIASAFGMEINK